MGAYGVLLHDALHRATHRQGRTRQTLCSIKGASGITQIQLAGFFL
jgi:hypothetical protein